MGSNERAVEAQLCACAEACGAQVRKVVYQGRSNSPDRWCFFPGGRLLIVECKAPGKKPTEGQLREMRTLRDQGFWVAWIRSVIDAGALVGAFRDERLGIDTFNRSWSL